MPGAHFYHQIPFKISEENIKKSKAAGFLQLTNWQQIWHYQAVLFLVCLSLAPPALTILDYYKTDFYRRQSQINFGINWFSLIPLALAVFYFFILKKRLKLTVLPTNLSRNQIDCVVDDVCEKFGWEKTTEGADHIILKTEDDYRAFLAPEQIVILIEPNLLFINSVRYLFARKKPFGKIGRNAENVQILIGKFERLKKD